MPSFPMHQSGGVLWLMLHSAQFIGIMLIWKATNMGNVKMK